MQPIEAYEFIFSRLTSGPSAQELSHLYTIADSCCARETIGDDRYDDLYESLAQYSEAIED